MRRHVFSIILCSLTAIPVFAADGSPDPAAQSVANAARWSGPYVGAHLAAGWGRANWKAPSGYLEAYSAYTNFPAHDSRGGLAGGLDLGYDWTVGERWIAGIAAEADALSLTNIADCADESTSIGFVCRSKPGATAAFRARIGRTAGDWLFYLSGGLAWLNETVAISAFNPNGYGATNAYNSATRNRLGAVYGAGVGTRLGDGLSARLEFVQYRFGTQSFSRTDRNMDVVYGATAGQTLSFVKTGLIYRFGSASGPEPSDYGIPAAAVTTADTLSDIAGAIAGFAGGLAGEIGLRSGWAGGGYRYDLYSSTDHSYMNSRLTWPGSGMTTEMFGRLEHSSGVYLKGLVGGIFLRNGDEMHDQDFLSVYDEENSDTIMIRRDSRSFYATVDLGYGFREGIWRFGPFVGYSRFEENQNAYGCVQLKDNPDICPSSDGVNYVGANQLILSHVTRWNALRIGGAGEVMATDRIRLRAEAAWLPLIGTGGSSDNHWLRPAINPLKNLGAGSGHGWQLEAEISYRLTERLGLGIGIRNWHARTRGKFQFATVDNTSPIREFVDRTMAFAQITYAFGGTPALTQTAERRP